MPQFSPGVHRVASILKLMADHPEQAFTVSDIVRALKISRATCHALLSSLAEEGFLYRANDKTYVLGPAIAHIGQVAAAHASPLQVARPEMRRLADEFDAICTAFFREDADVIVRERAAAVQHLGWSTPKGLRMRLRPPFGGVFYAWSSASEVTRWLDSLSPPASPDLCELMVQSMRFAQERGYTFAVRNARYTSLQWAQDQLHAGDQRDCPVSQMAHLEADQQYPLLSLLAPVFDVRGGVAFVLGLNGFTSEFSGSEIDRMGRRLREACDHVSAYSARGKAPRENLPRAQLA